MSQKPVHNNSDDELEVDAVEMQENNDIDEQSQSNSSNSVANKVIELQAELNVARMEIEEWKNKSLRLAADIQNQGRQSSLDSANSIKSGKKYAMQPTLQFLNTLHLAFAYTPQTEDTKVNAFMQTLKLSFEKLLGDLEKSGIKVLTANIGDEYDPSYMNSINTGDGSTAIAQIVSLGLEIDGQQVQPITVMFSEKKDEEPEATENDSEDTE